MSRFLDDARAIFEAAESASESGQCVSDFTMLIGQDGAIQMLVASDWPLDRLLAERGARAAYRVGETNGRIHVEARTARRTCRLESEPPQAVARNLLGNRKSFSPQRRRDAEMTESTFLCVSASLR